MSTRKALIHSMMNYKVNSMRNFVLRAITTSCKQVTWAGACRWWEEAALWEGLETVEDLMIKM
jgi:hypothetical protein